MLWFEISLSVFFFVTFCSFIFPVSLSDTHTHTDKTVANSRGPDMATSVLSPSLSIVSSSTSSAFLSQSPRVATVNFSKVNPISHPFLAFLLFNLLRHQFLPGFFSSFCVVISFVSSFLLIFLSDCFGFYFLPGHLLFLFVSFPSFLFLSFL